MKYYDKIPAKGYLYALSTDNVVCSPYKKNDTGISASGRDIFDLSRYHEVHLFDSDTEYRIIRDPCSENCEKVFVLTAEDETETEDFFVFEERQYISPEFSENGNRTEIAVVNWFSYSENDRPYLVNYRLRLIG